MKKVCVLAVICLLCACASKEEVYPYGLTKEEWNSLSIRDQTRLRRDFYFYEKGTTAYVNPNLEVEGKKDPAFEHKDEPMYRYVN